ncbi:helix-turn-helix domain-containing protein [Sphingosinicella rhizophila]|uniref:Cupin domain-containing protein n=1 Tax=Sphingosinicella rhizophila TaxID=3050082 RepID=A0ABU3Q5M5_9SPHN|nr:cupin domain-containing protein [Sphingosinicella sp. GR2756]MDT9598718.1 cupin domain-containing protein [Sphingosinicella sp. GR2756]
MQSQGDSLAGLGGRIRMMRKARGIKLNELAERSDLSSAFLSRLERGQVSSSVANLIQIAKALGVAVAELFHDGSVSSRSESAVHKVEDLDADQSVGSTGYKWRLLAGGMPDDDLEVFYLVFPRKDKMGTLVSHQGQEYCYVLSGKVRFIVGGKSFELGPGEGILTNSEIPHRAENIGRSEAQVLMVVTKTRVHGEHFDWWKTPSDDEGETKEQVVDDNVSVFTRAKRRRA